MNEKIIGKKQLTFIIEDEENEIFGYYYNTEVLESYSWWQETDNKSFHFNLQSNNNRLNEPMKFEIKNLIKGGIILCDPSNVDLIGIGNIGLYKEDSKNESHCYKNKNYFNYHGVKNALCGKEPDEYGNYFFTPKRILVIQMN